MSAVGDFLIEAVKLLGGVAGLGSAAFLVYDRLLRNRPALSLERRPVGAEAHACLRILNPADEEVLITIVECQPKGLIGVARNSSVEGAIRAAVQEPPTNLHLAPGAHASLPLVLLSSAQDQPHTPVKIIVRWRWMHRAWPPQRHSSLRTTRRDVKLIETARAVSRDSEGKKI
jgi:hypothetical protein